MNCPHHHQIFAEMNPSYKELPVRLAEYGTCYVTKQSGELFWFDARALFSNE